MSDFALENPLGPAARRPPTAADSAGFLSRRPPRWRILSAFLPVLTATGVLQAAPGIGVDPLTLAFAEQAYVAIGSQTLTVRNTGDSALDYTLDSDVFWLSAAGAGGSLAPGGFAQHEVAVSTCGLSPRTYSGTLTIAAAEATNSPRRVAVTLNVLPPQTPTAVTGWGYGFDGQTNAPASLTNAVAVGGGFSHSLALTADGHVAAWGSGLGTNVPPSLTNAVAIAAGPSHSLALTADGRVAAWGSGLGTNVPPGLTNAVAIAAGSSHSLALKSDGRVTAWGDNRFRQINVPFGLIHVIAVAAGSLHSLALKSDGRVAAWGSGVATNVPPGLTNAVAVAAGYYHSLALTADGRVTAWGSGLSTNVPPDLTDAVAIAAGYYHSLALTANGRVTAWGEDWYSQTDVPAQLTNTVAIAGGMYHSLALGVVGPLVVGPFVQFLSASSSGLESDGPVTVPIVLSEPLAVDVTVDYAAVGGTASNGVDYTLTPGTLTIPAGTVSTSIAFTVWGDADIERDETIVIRLVNAVNADLGARRLHTFTILSDDFTPPAVDNGTGAMALAPDSASLQARLISAGGLDTTLRIYWGDADGGTNASGWGRQPADLGPQAEGAYAVNVSGLLANKTYYYRSWASNAFGAIWADAATNFATPPPAIGFVTASSSGSESNVLVAGLIRLSHTSAVDVAVGYAAIGGTASNGTDYSFTPGTLTLPAGEVGASVTFTVTDDGEVGPDKTVVIGLLGPTNAVLGANREWTYTIEDANRPVFRFAVVSDTSSPLMTNSPLLAEVIQAIADERPDILILPGDMVEYPIPPLYQQWTNAMAPIYRAGIGVYPVRGNHDYDSYYDPTGAIWRAAFPYLPTNGPPGEVGLTYSFETPNALFIGLDVFVQKYRVNQTWLEAKLASNRLPHVFVFGHAPAFACGSHRDDGKNLAAYPASRDAFWNSLRAYGVKAYFCGHENFYDHARIEDGDAVPPNDVHQYTVATTDSEFDPDYGYSKTNSAPWTPIRQLHTNQIGYLLGKVRPDTATLTWKGRAASGVYVASDTIIYPSLHVDTDDDGMPDWWECRHGASITNLDPRADADTDGFRNLDEYLAGTDPTNERSLLAIVGLHPEADGIRVEWMGGATAAQLLEFSDDLRATTNGWVAVFTNPPPTALATNTLDAWKTNRALFYRIKVRP